MSIERTNRRDWVRTAGFLALASTVTGMPRLGWAEDSPSIRLTPDSSRNLYRVRVEMEVAGTVNVPKNALVSKEKATQFPIQAKSVLDWEERIVGFADDHTAAFAERYFHEASGESSSGKQSQRTELRDESRALFVSRDDSRWLTYSPQSYLNDAELGLLELPACSLAVDGLLPTAAVRAGDTYRPSNEVLAKLLALAAVDQNEVVGEIKSIDADNVKIHLNGKVHGSTAGVPTTLDVVGKMVFDRQTLTSSWLALAIREQREIGKAEPGFDVAATIKMVRKPLETPIRLQAKAAALPQGGVPAERLYCELSSQPVGFTCLMDRRWKKMSDAAGGCMMRMVDSDRAIAQCDIRPVGATAAGTQVTMAAFITDVKQSLGKRFGQLLESREEVNEFGLRVLRVSTQGLVEGVPVQWVFLHFSNDAGRRMLATMTIGGAELDVFTGADVQLTGSLRFIPTEEEATEVATTKVMGSNKK